MDALPLPSAAVLSYVAKFGAGAIYTFAPPRGCPVLIGAGQDIAGALMASRKSWSADVELAWCRWARDTRACQQLVTLAIGCELRLAARDGQRLTIPVEEAATAVLAAAQRLAIGLTDHAVLLARAQAALAHLDTGIRAANVAGQLKFFNQEYARRRRAAATLGRKFMSYAHACTRLQEVLAGAAAGEQLEGRQIIEQVFGRDGTADRKYKRAR
jgi:hypothetical protein